MIYLLPAIICSVLVSILFKLMKRYELNALHAIIVNYPVAALLCLVLFKPYVSATTAIHHLDLLVPIAVLLISIFYFISKSIQTSGIVLTAVAQRLSLIIPVLAAFLIYQEQLNSLKIIGLIIGFLAIFASLPQKKEAGFKLNIWYPIIVFLGTGIIDVLFNQLTQLKNLAFTGALFIIFCMATILGAAFILYQLFARKYVFSLFSIGCGVVLGILNFGSIYFYVRALAAEPQRPSVIFSTLDIGVITGGTIIGVFIFKEFLSTRNKMAVLLAILAIAILTFS